MFAQLCLAVLRYLPGLGRIFEDVKGISGLRQVLQPLDLDRYRWAGFVNHHPTVVNQGANPAMDRAGHKRISDRQSVPF